MAKFFGSLLASLAIAAVVSATLSTGTTKSMISKADVLVTSPPRRTTMFPLSLLLVLMGPRLKSNSTPEEDLILNQIDTTHWTLGDTRGGGRWTSWTARPNAQLGAPMMLEDVGSSSGPDAQQPFTMRYPSNMDETVLLQRMICHAA
ncbi:hypothetical protein K438DRAFT_1751333 [Mycena galopus ATCC 62051]|nr:hypothetical protein K438DRAFT_1751333 [Mycena galopus ATCC 62051]